MQVLHWILFFFLPSLAMLKWELPQAHIVTEAFQAFSSQQSSLKRTSSAMGFTQRITTGLGSTTTTSETSVDVSIDARRAVTTLHTSLSWIRKTPNQGPTCLERGIYLTSAQGLSFAQWKGWSSPVAPPTCRAEHSLLAVENAGLS